MYHMKNIASLLLILSILGIGVFSFSFIDHSMQDSDKNCASTVMGKTVCPTNIAAMTSHHISTIQALTTAVLSDSFTLVLSMSLILTLASVFLLYKILPLVRFRLLSRRLRDLDLIFSYSRQRVTSWLSLFELSPSL